MEKAVRVGPHCGQQRNVKVFLHRGFNDVPNAVTGNMKEHTNSFRTRVSRLRLATYRLHTVTSRKSVCLCKVAVFFDVTVCSRYVAKRSRETRVRKLLMFSFMLPVTALGISLNPRCKNTLTFRCCPQCGPTRTAFSIRHQMKRRAHRWKAYSVSFPTHRSSHQTMHASRRYHGLNAHRY
jgi:hypothetical protein